MSRKKDKEPGEGAFRNAPFRELKKFTPRDAPPAPVKQRPTAPAIRQEGDDEDLFRRAMAGARPVGREDEDAEGPAAVPKTAKPQKHVEPDQQSGDQFLLAMQSLGTSALRPEPDDDEGTDAGERRSASSRMRQLKKGALRISGELDLHGFLRDEALRRLAHFIEGASARAQQAVLVITGKGNNSSDGPVLPGAVADWLRGPGAAQVAEFHPAPRDKGGSGAYVVFLRKK